MKMRGTGSRLIARLKRGNANPLIALLPFGLTMLITPLAPMTVLASESRHDLTGHKHIALFLGTGEESSDASHWHPADAVGIEFEYRLSNSMGIGVVIEDLNVDNRGNTVIIAPFSYHFGSGFRAFAGPGYEFANSGLKSNFLFRVGIGYEFRISERWSVAPELLNDFVDRNGETWLAGIAVGYGF